METVRETTLDTASISLRVTCRLRASVESGTRIARPVSNLRRGRAASSEIEFLPAQYLCVGSGRANLFIELSFNKKAGKFTMDTLVEYSAVSAKL